MLDTISSRTTPDTVDGIWARPPAVPENPLDRLGDEIAKLSAMIQAANYQLLVLIREFDARGGWNCGFRSCAHWLNWRTGLDMGAAREKVRVAHALGKLPQTSESMQRGELSYSKVRALTRVATSEVESELLEFARAGTAAQVERLVRAWRRVDRIEAMEEGSLQLEQRNLKTYTDEDGMLVIRARLTPEVGAVLLKALEAANEVLFKNSQETDDSDWAGVPTEQRRADALELLAECALEGGLDPGTAGDRYQVVVHVHDGVSAETSCCTDSGEAEDGELEGGMHVSAETSRRLQCDSSRIVITHGSDGRILDVGRKTRAIHPALRRALQFRDGGCRFPGCMAQHCDAHHVEHWADGGTTNLDNLLLLCRFHHRALHEGGYRVELGEDGKSRFFEPNGALILVAPPTPETSRHPVSDLERDHQKIGIEINALTGLPSWDGSVVYLNDAIQALRVDISDERQVLGLEIEDCGTSRSDIPAETSQHDFPKALDPPPGVARH